MYTNSSHKRQLPSLLENYLLSPLGQIVFFPSFYDSVTQASFFSAGLQAIDKRATKDNASVSIMALHAQVLLEVLEVSCAVKQAGEGFAVFLVVVVKKYFWRAGQSFCFGNYAPPLVKGTLVLWNWMAQPN